jgi:hypothetical protein
MARPKIVNEKNLRLAIQGSFGNQAYIAKKLRCTYQTIYNAFKEYPQLRELLEEEHNKLLDSAEWVVADAIVNKKDVNTAKWVLEKRGASRGYNPELEEMKKDNMLKIVFTDKIDEENSN